MQAPAAVGGAAPAAFLLAMPRIVGGAAPAAAGEGATIVGVAPFFPVAAGGGATIVGGAMILGGAAAAIVAALGGAPDDFALLVEEHNKFASASTTASFALPSVTSSSVLAPRILPSSLRKMAS